MLAINTAFMTANLALEASAGQVVLRDTDAKSKHSENVLNTINQLCMEARIDILDIKTLAVVTGPGSFTGLRIGAAIAQALGCVNPDLKFLALSSLEVMAYIVVRNKLCNKKFVCVLNALSDLYFVAYFDKTGIKLQSEAMINKQAFLSIKQPIFAIKNDLQEMNVQEIEITGQRLLEFAKIQKDIGNFVRAEAMLPMYLRASQAEDNLHKKIKKN